MLTLSRDLAAPAPGASAAKPEALPAFNLSVETDIGVLEKAWRDFESSAVGHVFQSFSFVSTWLAHVGTVRRIEPRIVVGRAGDGTISFLLPFGLTNCFGARLLEWLGGEHADYHNGLYEPRFLERLAAEEGAGRRFVDDVLALFDGMVDMVHFQRQPEKIGGFANPFAAYKSTPYSARAHLTHLGNDWDTYYRSKRNSSSRRHDRLKWQKMEAAMPPVEIIDATTPADTDMVLGALYAQKKASLAARGVPDFFAKAGTSEFYRALAAHPWPEGLTHVSAIRAGGEIVAANWALIRGDRYYYVMTSYAGGPSAAFSPGRALMYHLMRWCIGRGIEVFDFTIGDEDFKAHWCEETCTIHDSVIVVTPRGLPLGLLMRTMKAAKKSVKTRPRLNAFVHRIRGRVSARG